MKRKHYGTPTLTRYGTMKSITRGAAGSGPLDDADVSKARDPEKDPNDADVNETKNVEDNNWTDAENADGNNVTKTADSKANNQDDNDPNTADIDTNADPDT